MLISFVYPAFNRADLFERTLASFLEQKGREETPFEIIVVDDGSTDGMKRLCQDYRERLPIRYVRIDVHRVPYEVFQFEGANNPAPANNVGIRLAKGARVVLSSPEVYHLKETNLLGLAGYPLEQKDALIANVYDRDMGVIGGGLGGRALHFLGVFNKSLLVGLGGFEERFVGGWGWEDTEFVERCGRVGVQYHFSLESIEGFHQPHPRVEFQGSFNAQNAYMRNEELCMTARREGWRVANQDHEWGSANLIIDMWP